MVAETWSLEARVLKMPLAERFTIARETWDVATSVFAVVRYGDAEGYGECSPDAHWGETPEGTVEQLHALDLSQLHGPFDLEGPGTLLPAGSARCVLDVALHDLAGKLAGLPLRLLLGVGEAPLPQTSVTVPIADVETMRKRAASFADHPVVKTKVGFDGDVDAIAAIREVFGGRLRVDANEGWTEQQAIDRLAQLERFDVELCEQPIPNHRHDVLRRVTQASPIPVYADEDAGTSADVAALAGVVDGVNLKLRKAGGIRETWRAIATARAHGMGVMLGCDLDSGIAMSAAAALAPLCDFIDLDGPLLLAKDPHPAVGYDRGELIVPAGAGLGVETRPWPVASASGRG
ncbi:MAG: dipeptide epimerase [Actinomycetota bacterium]|nr:dipeptide epimerase [Actinomycetota bacterium]